MIPNLLNNDYNHIYDCHISLIKNYSNSIKIKVIKSQHIIDRQLEQWIEIWRILAEDTPRYPRDIYN